MSCLMNLLMMCLATFAVGLPADLIQEGTSTSHTATLTTGKRHPEALGANSVVALDCTACCFDTDCDSDGLDACDC